MKKGYIYILASQKNGTIYIGVTSNLPKRIYEHKSGLVDGFTKTHNVKTLVYYEVLDGIENALHREKRLKKYTRKAKLKLIEADNPNWNDLYEEICN